MYRRSFTAVLAIAGCGAALFLASAAAPKATGVAVGYVDLKSVFTDAPVAQAAVASTGSVGAEDFRQA